MAVHPVDGDVDEQLWADVRPDAARRLLVAAVRAFATTGYHGTTTRDITTQAGMSPGALYVHFPTKADLLARIAVDGHRATLAEVEAALGGLVGATERVEAFVAAFVAWHARHHVVARVAHHDLVALPPAAFRTVAGLRRQIDHLLRDAIVTGAAAGTFDVDEPRLATRAILSLGIDVARWYGLGEGARPDPTMLGDYYAQLAARMLAAPSAVRPGVQRRLRGGGTGTGRPGQGHSGPSTTR